MAPLSLCDKVSPLAKSWRNQNFQGESSFKVHAPLLTKVGAFLHQVGVGMMPWLFSFGTPIVLLRGGPLKSSKYYSYWVSRFLLPNFPLGHWLTPTDSKGTLPSNLDQLHWNSIPQQQLAVALDSGGGQKLFDIFDEVFTGWGCNTQLKKNIHKPAGIHALLEHFKKFTVGIWWVV